MLTAAIDGSYRHNSCLKSHLLVLTYIICHKAKMECQFAVLKKFNNKLDCYLCDSLYNVFAKKNLTHS